ncbi:MAG: hypothetical protein ABI266_08970, partial [Ginsengibacter sp.]
ANDSSRALFRYDTVNKRISVISDLSISEGNDFDSMIYQYNNDLMLTRISIMDAQASSDPSYVVSIDYKYDADKVIQLAKFTDYSGDNYTYSFNKTSLPGGGYRLSWKNTSPYNGPGDTYLASFDGKGQMISNYYSLYSDSLLYDEVGNIKKVLKTYYKNPNDIKDSKTFTLYDFTLRESKGDQLYNLNQVLNRGIANLNVMNGSIGGDLFSVDYVYQFTKYPATSIILHRSSIYSNCPNCPDYEINSTSQPMYDSQQRLVRYKVVYNDYPLSYLEFYIRYYK